jgi:tetratricopeptide (TPR) repeat protein
VIADGARERTTPGSASIPSSAPLFTRAAVRAAMVVFAVATAVYLPKTVNRFTFDDRIFILLDANVRDVHAALGEFGRDQARLYRPLRSVALASLTSAFGRQRPLPFHVAGILLHAACAALLTLIVWLLVADPPAALFAGLIFALHPVHADRVANITGSFDLLGLALGWGAWLLALLYDRGARAWTAGAAALALLLGCLASEEALMVWPLAAACFLLWPGDRRRRRRVMALLTAVVAGYLLARSLVLGGAARTAAYAAGSLSNTIWTMAVVAWRYVGLLFFPVGLSAAYGPTVRTQLDPAAAAGLLGIAALLGAAVALRRRPAISLAIVWFFLGLAPFSNLLRGDTLMAERYLYAGSGGFALAAGLLAAGLRVRRRAATAAMAVVLAIYAVGVVSRCAAWGRPVQLWTEAAVREPNSFLANLNAGYHSLVAGKTNNAERFAAQARRLEPQRAEPLMQLAEVAFGRHADGEAVRWLTTATETDPAYCPAFSALAKACVQTKDYPRAARTAVAALNCDPQESGAHYVLAYLLVAAGHCDEAAAHWSAIIRAQPEPPDYQAAIELRAHCARSKD